VVPSWSSRPKAKHVQREWLSPQEDITNGKAPMCADCASRASHQRGVCRGEVPPSTRARRASYPAQCLNADSNDPIAALKHGTEHSQGVFAQPTTVGYEVQYCTCSIPTPWSHLQSALVAAAWMFLGAGSTVCGTVRRRTCCGKFYGFSTYGAV
jgi:hypothetical protein